jgi:hypothetical protein
MGILNTFYILFKSNADDVIKGNKAIEKSTKETERNLKNTNEEAKKLGENFVKSMDALATAAGAVAGFNILKNGINQAATFNAQLKIMGDLTQQNVQTLKTMGQAAANAGGSAEGALADIQGLTNMANASGKPLGPVNDYFQAVRNKLRGRSLNEQQRALSMIGINDPGLRRLLSPGITSDQDYEGRMGRAEKISPVSQSSVDNAFNKIESDSVFRGSVATFFTRSFDKVSGLYQKSVNKMSEMILGSSESTGGIVAGNAAVLGGATAGAFGLWKSIKALVGLGGRAGAAIPGAAAPVAVGGAALGAGGLAGYYGLGLFSKPIENMLIRMMGQDPSLADGPLTSTIRTGNADLDFWMSKGYTREQAAGIMANMKHESGGNPGARGDGGRAHGLFQWHPDRRAAIMNGTGIDISNATYQQQLEAAAWEMKNEPGFSDEFFRSLSTSDAAAAYFSTNFERPANGGIQALLRGKTALGIASSFPSAGLGGNTTSVQIDKIEINTQATDANGIAADLREQIYSELSALQANYDDGVSK